MTRDPIDKRRPERTLVSFVVSLLLHAIAALFLFSLATSSSDETAPESSVNGVVVTISRQAPRTPAGVQTAQHAQPPAPHASVVPKPQVAARPQAAPPHPRVLHELSKFAPTAPPNPTPAPESTSQPAPVATQQPQIAVSSAPMVAAVPTSVPLPVTAVTIKTPPSATPVPKPSPIASAAPIKRAPQPTAQPTVAPRQTPAPTAAPTAQPEPSPLQASAAIAMAKPIAVVTPAAQPRIRIPQSQQQGLSPTPGPKSPGSPGPKPVAAVKGPQVARPIQAPPATPRPAAPIASKRERSLNQRLRNLIPSANPSMSPPPQTHYHFSGSLLSTPPPPPTPPPDVLANTKFLYLENVAGQRWKQSFLGTAPEEVAVEMYVTSVKRIGPIKWCTGWVARLPEPGSRGGYLVDSDRDLEPKWIVEPNSSFICGGHLEPFTPPTPEPPKGS